MAYPLIEQLINQYMFTDKWYKRQWHYTEACILKAYLDRYELTGDSRYYSFVKQFVDGLFDDSGNIPQLDWGYYNIDQIKMGSILLELYRLEADSRYLGIAARLHQQLQTYPRTPSGSFWHKSNYPNQIWLDGLYMAQPFSAQYTKEFLSGKDYADCVLQLTNVRKFLFNEQDCLYYHAYDESREIFWCDPATGRSPCVWGRAVGWYAMALIDVIHIVEDDPAVREPLEAILRETIDGMIPYQHPSGMWHQVVNVTDRPDNYLESSGTLMLAYSILKAVRLGVLPESYAHYGQSALAGTVDQYLGTVEDEVQLGGICQSAGVGRNPETGVVRDGTYEYYIHRENIVSNNGHGVAPLIMAYNELQRGQGR